MKHQRWLTILTAIPLLLFLADFTIRRSPLKRVILEQMDDYEQEIHRAFPSPGVSRTYLWVRTWLLGRDDPAVLLTHKELIQKLPPGDGRTNELRSYVQECSRAFGAEDHRTLEARLELAETFSPSDKINEYRALIAIMDRHSLVVLNGKNLRWELFHAYQMSGHLEEAEQVAREMLAKGKSLSTQLTLAGVLHQEGKFQEEESLLLEISKIDEYGQSLRRMAMDSRPFHGQAYTRLAACLQSQGKLAQAERYAWMGFQEYTWRHARANSEKQYTLWRDIRNAMEDP